MRKNINIGTLLFTTLLTASLLAGCSSATESPSLAPGAGESSVVTSPAQSEDGKEQGGTSSGEPTGADENVSSSSYQISEEDADTSVPADAAKISLSDSGITVTGRGAQANGSGVTIQEGGTYILEGALSDGEVVIAAADGDIVRLILNGVRITSSKTAAISMLSGSKLIVTLAEGTENTLVDAQNYQYENDENEPDAALFAQKDMTINGSGMLTVKGQFEEAIKAKANLLIASGNLVLWSADDALNGKASVTVADGDITLSASGKGITSEGAVAVYAGSLFINESEEGIEGLTVDIYGGEVNIVSSDDGLNARIKADDTMSEAQKNALSEQNNADVWIRISGGKVSVNAEGDGIDSNGQLYITGGTTVLYGPSAPDNGLLDYNGEGSVTGGTFIAVGMEGMAQYFGSGSTQNTALLRYDNSLPAGTQIQVLDASGEEIFLLSAEKAFNMVYVSAPSFTVGEEITIKAGEDTQSVAVRSGDSEPQRGGFGPGRGERGDMAPPAGGERRFPEGENGTARPNENGRPNDGTRFDDGGHRPPLVDDAAR